MKIHCESIGHYLHWIRTGWTFSMAGFSDAEWYCLLGQRLGDKTGLGQVIDASHGMKLLDVLKRRQHDNRFLFAVPKCLWTLPGFAEGQIDWFLGNKNIRIDGYERDMVTDDLARDAELYPFIAEIRKWPTCMIGPAPLRAMDRHLRYRHFVEISTPNLHMEPGGIERAIEDAKRWGQPGLYLVSAGVSAACIIDGLHGIKDAWLIDCGSIWDAFVKIGGQRQWRADLYADNARWKQWVRFNVDGKPRA